ncbi:MAG: VOC family protein [Chloroflexi bacterium]|nr:VOC family protein [Chloroflexota bacterium]
MLKRFAYHGVTVSDLDRSVAFYRDVLDMKVEKTYEVAGGYLAQATGLPGAHAKIAVLNFTDTFGDHLVKLFQYLAPQGKKRFEARLNDVGASHFDICTNDVRQLYEQLLAKGARFISPPVVPMPQRPHRSFAFMLDPDGMVIEIHLDTPHHAHIISDQDRSLDFYQNTLGMKLWRINDIFGPGISEGAGIQEAHKLASHLILDTEEFIELFYWVHPKGKQHSDMRLCDVGCSYVAFEVDSVQGSYEELRAKGVKLLSPPVREQVGEATIVYLVDPDGYPFELRSADAPV